MQRGAIQQLFSNFPQDDLGKYAQIFGLHVYYGFNLCIKYEEDDHIYDDNSAWEKLWWIICLSAAVINSLRPRQVPIDYLIEKTKSEKQH